MATITPDETSARKPLGEAAHDGYATASLILGILWLGGLGSLLAVIFGHLSHGASRRAERRNSGVATAGLVLGYIGLAGAALLTALLIAAAASTPSSGAYMTCVNNAIANGTSTLAC